MYRNSLLDELENLLIAERHSAPRDDPFCLINIEEETALNEAYRRVLCTTKELQLVLMCVEKQDGYIPLEKHDNVSQFIRIEAGYGVAVLNGASRPLSPGMSFVVPAGTWHEIRQRGEAPLKLYTIYSGPQPQHRPGLVQERRPERDSEGH